jgi:hypothetical protein
VGPKEIGVMVQVGSEWGPVAGSCEHVNDPLGYIKRGVLFLSVERLTASLWNQLPL